MGASFPAQLKGPFECPWDMDFWARSTPFPWGKIIDSSRRESSPYRVASSCESRQGPISTSRRHSQIALPPPPSLVTISISASLAHDCLHHVLHSPVYHRRRSNASRSSSFSATVAVVLASMVTTRGASLELATWRRTSYLGTRRLRCVASYTRW